MKTPAELREIVEDYVTRFNRQDGAAIAELFHPNGSAADPVNSEPHVGREAIAAFFSGTFEGLDGTLRLDGDIRVAGPHVAFPLQMTMQLGDQQGRLDIIDVFEFDDDGRIVSMRAYWDAADMQLGD